MDFAIPALHCAALLMFSASNTTQKPPSSCHSRLWRDLSQARPISTSCWQKSCWIPCALLPFCRKKSPGHNRDAQQLPGGQSPSIAPQAADLERLSSESTETSSSGSEPNTQPQQPHAQVMNSTSPANQSLPQCWRFVEAEKNWPVLRILQREHAFGPCMLSRCSQPMRHRLKAMLTFNNSG